MELDAMKEKWAEYDRKLDVGIRLGVMAATRDGVQSPLRRFSVLVGLGAAFGLIGTFILGQFIYSHWSEPRYALPAVVMDIWTIAALAASIRQMVMAAGIEYDAPVAAIQRQIERLRALRLRTIQWALLSGQVVWWIPFLIVALKGFFDVDVYAVCGTGFLAVNLIFGLVLIPVAIAATKKLGDRAGKSPAIRWLMTSLAGYNLNAASAFLATLSEFENA